MSAVSVTSHDPADVHVATDNVQSSTHREMGVKHEVITAQRAYPMHAALSGRGAGYEKLFQD